MRIIISDANRIWTPDHPALEPFAEIVLVVCMYGKAVTDKYRCFVSEPRAWGLGMAMGKESAMYRALDAKADELVRLLLYHDDIVFLTDGEYASLYPFMTVRERDEYNNLHLVSMSPWSFETKRRIQFHRAVLSDLSDVSSLLWINADTVMNEMDPKSTMPDLYTGKSNRSVIQNLKKLIERVPPERIWIRVPHIPWINKDEDVERSIEELRKMGFDHIEEFGYEFSQFVKKEPSKRSLAQSSLQIPEYLKKKMEEQ
jgi:hypothetical protein